MEFHSPVLADLSEVQKIFNEESTDCCEYCFGNIYMWSDVYNNKIAVNDGVFVSKIFSEGVYCYPRGKGDKKKVIEEIIKNGKAQFYGLTEKDKEELEKLFPEKFEFTTDRDAYEYIYKTEDLALLPGKKYHSKKNHISYFEKNFDWHFEEITPDNIERCRILNDQWERLNEKKDPEEISSEHEAINKAFDNFFKLGLFGGILFVEDEAIAFTFGEKLNDNTFCTHVEKAYANFRGAYQTVNRELAKALLGKYEYINREEDTGSDGLRSAKLSYKPCTLLTKYVAVYKDKSPSEDLQKNLSNLWQRVFDEDERVTKLFFEKVYPLCENLIIEQDGKVVSSAFLIPCEIENRKGLYVYCAMTDEKYRGRGLMAEILSKADEIKTAKNLDFLLLVPANEGLFEYYKKFGYVPFGYSFEADVPKEYKTVSEKYSEARSFSGTELRFPASVLDYWANSVKIYGGEIIETDGTVCLLGDCVSDAQKGRKKQNTAMIKTHINELKNLDCYVGITLE